MTERNIEIMEVIVDKMAEGKNLADALKDVYVKRNVAVPFDFVDLDIGVDKLGMSKRSTYALLRGRLNTLMDVLRYCETKKITTVNMLGVNAGIEIFETILNYLWSKMSVSERTDFLIDTVERNSGNIRAEIM